MNQKANSFQLILEGLQKGDDKALKYLYRLLYNRSRDLILKEGLHLEADEVFQDAFIVLHRKLLEKKLKFPKGVDNNLVQKEQLQKYFERILIRLIYSPTRSVFYTLEGIKKDKKQAIDQLALFFQNALFQGYVRKQIANFNIVTMEANDFILKGITILIEKIIKEEFTVPETDDNEQNTNRIAKFFNQIIYRQVSKWQRDHSRKESKKMKYVEEQSGLDENPQNLENVSIVKEFKVIELFENLDKVGKFILRESYLNHLTPKQIAQKIPFEEYHSTEKINVKKIECLKKLGTDLVAWQSTLGEKAIKKLGEVTSTVMANLLEPCKTILRHTLPPINKPPEEVAVILQQTRPQEEVSNLRTAAQVKKRKYKCKLTLMDAIWKQLLNPQI